MKTINNAEMLRVEFRRGSNGEDGIDVKIANGSAVIFR